MIGFGGMRVFCRAVTAPTKQLLRSLALCVALSALVAGSASAAPLVPVATTGPVAAITSSSAVATGAVDPRGLPTTYFFRYGPTKAYGFVSGSASAGTGSSTVHIAANLRPLSEDTHYHVQLVAESAAGPAFGSDRTFTTKLTPDTVILGTAPNPVRFGQMVAVNGLLQGAGVVGVSVELFANPFPYLAGFKQVGNTELSNAAGQFFFNALPTVTTQYEVKALGKVNTVTAIAVVGVASKVGIVVHRARRHNGLTVIDGTVLPAHPGSLALVELLRPHGSYRIVDFTTVHGGGPTSPSKFVARFHVHQSGHYRVEVRAGDGINLTGYSPVFRLRKH